MKSSKLFYQLLTFANILFLIYFITIGYFNQPALDDYCVIAAQNTDGFNSPITYWYKYWNGRFLPLYFCNLLFIFFQYTGSIIWLTLILIIGFIFSINRLLKEFFNSFSSQQNIEKSKILNLAIFLFNIFVFNNFKFNTFFWLNASTMYYGGIMFFLLGLGEVYTSKNKWYSILFIAFSFFYAGSSTENHALVFILLMFLIILLNLLIYKTIHFKYSKKTYIAIAFLLFSFTILMLAPGSQHRFVNTTENIDSTEKSLNIVSFLINFGNKYLLVLAEIAVFYLPFVLIFIPILIYIYFDLLRDFKVKFQIFKFGKWPIIILLALFIGSAIAPTVYIFGMLGPQRILTIANAIILLFILVGGLYIFSFKNDFLKEKISIIHSISLFSFVVICTLILSRMYNEFPILQKYKQAEETKREAIESSIDNKTTIQYYNAEAFNKPTITEKICLIVLEKYFPHKIDTWGNLIKYEPVLPNIIDKNDKTVYDECYSNAFGKKINIHLETESDMK